MNNNNDKIYAFEPILGKWYVKEFLGSGSIGKVYKVSSKVYNKEYISAIKFLSIPTDEQYENIINSLGNDKELISNYFNSYIEDILNEINLLYELKGHSNIISYEDHFIHKDTSEEKWYIIIRMEYAKSLVDFLKTDTISINEVLKLGIDICSALELCHKKNILHRDIKEANIFISQNNSFKLGDFSVSKNISEQTSAKTKVGTINYMAPEVINGKKYNVNSDIYSLGIVLYKLLNRGKLPFLSKESKTITHLDIETACIKRLQGEPFEKLKNVDKNINNIILKACSFSPKDRFQSASEMKNELIKALSSEKSITTVDNKFYTKKFANTINTNNTPTYSNTIDIFNSKNSNVDTQKSKGNNIKRNLILSAIALVAILITIGINFSNNNNNTTTTKSKHIVNNTNEPKNTSIDETLMPDNTVLKKTDISPENSIAPTSSIVSKNTVSPINTEKISTSPQSNTPKISNSTTPNTTVKNISYGKNLAKNTGAEDGFTSWIKSFDESSDGESSTVNSSVFTGKYSFEFKKYNKVKWHYLDQYIPTKPGATYLVEAYCKTDSVSGIGGSTSGAILAFGPKNSSNQTVWIFAKNLTGTNNWTKISCTGTVPIDTTSTSMRICIGLRESTGTAYFDDISIREIIK